LLRDFPRPNLYPRSLLPLIAASGCVFAFIWWISLDSPRPIRMRVPVAWVRSQPDSSLGTRNAGTLIPGPGRPADIPGSWPEFRGPGRDNIASSDTPLARQWPEKGPPVLWRVEMGEGHAGAAIREGRVYVIDYDRDKEEDAIRCLSLADGREIWRYTYSITIKRNHGMSRTVPAVNDRYLVAIGPKCHIHCLDPQTGELKWKMDLVEEYGVEIPPWYAGQCPIIEGDNVIIAPGASPLMVAVSLETGEVVWRTPPEVDGMGMTHSSIEPLEFAGIRQYVYCSRQGVVSVAADDGRVLWTQPGWKIPIANIPSPVWLGDDRIFFSGGYNSGAALYRLVTENSTIQTEEVFRLKAQTFGSDQQTPVHYGDHIYGVSPKPAEMVCLDLDGERLWTSGGSRRFGLGPYMIVDDLLLILDDQEGMLHLAEARPDGYHELARADLLVGHDCWGPMAYAAGRLILRDLTEMICVDLRESNVGGESK